MIAVGVGKGNIENGGCVWKLKNDDVVIGMEGGREKEETERVGKNGKEGEVKERVTVRVKWRERC